MKYILRNIRIPVQKEQNLQKRVNDYVKGHNSGLLNWSISRRALDTRKKNHPVFDYTLEIEVDTALPAHPDLSIVKPTKTDAFPGKKLDNSDPYIIGMGPAGLFCALAMVENGLKPHLFDRGEKLDARAATVSQFWKHGLLNPESNVQFGEGGAGAFSDGKLTSRGRNSVTEKVFDLLTKFGAPEEIKWEALPHLGTDGIRNVVKNIRKYLQEHGCTFHYSNRLDSLALEGNAVNKVTINSEQHNPEMLVLALGNASRDTYRMLNCNVIKLAAKPFAIGFRISHPQDWINRTVYGNEEWAGQLGAAYYRMSSPQSKKNAYTFCMCPGGEIIAASSAPGTIVTNGMSYSARNNSYGNSAVVVSVDDSDYGSGLFSGMDLQARIETKAYKSGYPARYQLAKDFITGTLSASRNVSCLFPDVVPAIISELYNQDINKALLSGLKHFDHILNGFINEGLIIAPETRTSSPLRILRDKTYLNCLGINNLYAIGEGSGYAGGIISSAADGYRIGRMFSL